MRVLLSNCLIINAAHAADALFKPEIETGTDRSYLVPNDGMAETVFKQEDELKGYLSTHCSKKHK